jgi:hypothetical protein
MATFNVTTAVNIDTLSVKAGSDTYNINGGYLTVDQDTRYGTNQNTSAAMGNITLSATLGGTIEFNAEKVRLIPYDGGAGVVPAYNTTISGTTGSGLLIGVISALNATPTAVGAAMPASGFIKIKQWNDVAYTDNDALTGITATVNGTDRVGWLEIVGVNDLLSTANRLGTYKVRGAWFDLGTTDGARATTYQIPSNGSLVYLPGVWVETAASSGVYEFYPCAGTLTATATNVATDEVRGRWCWISTAGLLRFGHDGTNLTGGFIPETGRKIRIPNIFFVCCTAAALTANVLPNATPGTRYEFATTGGGVLDIQKACFNWYMNINQPYSVALTDVAIMSTLVVTECATAIAWSNVGVGQEAANTQFGLSMSTCFAGGTMTDCVWTRATLASSGHYVTTLTDMRDFVFTNERIHALGGARGNASTGASTLTRVNSCSWIDSLRGGGKNQVVTCADISFTNTTYYDHPATTTPTTNAAYAFELLTNCTRVTIDGIDFGGLTLCQPYNGILLVGAAGHSEVNLRNIGSYASPLDLGGATQSDVAWTRVTTTATVTKIAHGLKVNDIVYVFISSSVAAITIAAKTVASVPSADTFTFTCLNAGSASGTLSYYPTMSSLLFTTATGNANGVYVKRCYAKNLRTNLFTTDNGNKNIVIENCSANNESNPVTPMLNGEIKGIYSTPTFAAQTSCYGTHWIDSFISAIPANTAAVSWTRATTTATVTSADHGLRTGALINVTVSSSAAAIVLGQKTVTAATKDTFTFTCLNAGDASGTLTFVPLISRIGLVMNEATSDTTGVYTIDAGSTAFTSAGGLYMPAVNDQITFELPYYLIGHTGFPIAEAVMAGGTISNYNIYYSIDKNDGNGFSSYKNLYYQRTGAGGASSSTNVTMTSTTGVAVGDYVWGTNIAPNAKVSSITDATTVVVDIANTGTVSGTLRFNQMPSETSIDAQLGFKLRIRVITGTVNATAITSLYVISQSTETSRAYQYILDPVTIQAEVLDASTGLAISGARVYIEADTGGPLPYQEAVTITRSGATATVTHASHGLSSGSKIKVKGATQTEYNGIYTITVIDSGSYSYTVSGSPATPATGSPIVTAVIINETTDVSGIVSDTSFPFIGNQPVTGRARKADTSPLYQSNIIAGTITSSGLDSLVFLIRDD